MAKCREAAGAIALKGARNARTMVKHHNTHVYVQYTCTVCHLRDVSPVRDVRPERKRRGRVWNRWVRDGQVPSRSEEPAPRMQHRGGSAGVLKYLRSPCHHRRRQFPRGRAQTGAQPLDLCLIPASGHAS